MTARAELRVAAIGAGGHASTAILPALADTGATLVVIADLDLERAEAAARRFGFDAVTDDHRQLLGRDDIDGVVVVGPASMHAAVGTDVVNAGHPLFVEKPPAPDLAGALALRDAATATGVAVTVGFQKRFARTYAHARDLSRRADFGTPRLLRLEYAHWQTPNLLEHLTVMSIHALDLSRWLLGDVTAGVVHRVEDGPWRTLALDLRHDSGGVSQLHLSSIAPRVQESLSLFGDGTMIEVQNLTRLVSHRATPTVMDALQTDETNMALWQPDMTIPLASHATAALQGYAGELAAWVDSLKGQAVDDLATLDDAIAALRLIDAIHAAPEGQHYLELRAPA